ncbi:endo-1,4-beta-xylanase [Microlunatus flavus]|uniref:Beta-xylanase n=1 Tax=Microlunatus flavus TaxID=1036181 RepID=A0A1H9HP41_9ACTN|nr:endo-1,4-beta-xylanase [Microlunatus flavus]SEQ64077.1 endo-1,4-beta-xylanase [Microlunatus flavus]
MSLRRTCLGLVTAGALASALLAGGAPAAGAATDDTGTTKTLKQLAKPTGVRIGTAVDTAALADDATYASAVAKQFNTITPENVMKWEVVEPERGKLDFTEADKLVDFARAHKQKVRGHTLVWHSQLPAWLTKGVDDGSITKKQLRRILKQHIATEVGHFKGDIWAWDVVNEAFNDDGTLRDSLWLRELGPGYIADAFRWAHKADKKAILFYNDYNTEGINPKSDAVYKLVKELRSEGVPIEAVGVQGHLSTDYPLPADMQANLHRFGKLGLKTAVTEADVRITLPASAAEVQAQDNGYSYMLQSCLLERSCISFTVWGFTDKYSWIPGVFPGEGQANLYDESYQPKSAYAAVQRDLQLAKGIKKH